MLEPGVFRGLDSLNELQIEHNVGLVSLQPGVFNGLPTLERLKIRYTSVQGLSAGVFTE